MAVSSLGAIGYGRTWPSPTGLLIDYKKKNSFSK